MGRISFDDEGHIPMNYPPVLHFATVYKNACPTCGAPPMFHCISTRGKRQTKTHVARSKKVQNHTPLPDLTKWWRAQAKAEKRFRKAGVLLLLLLVPTFARALPDAPVAKIEQRQRVIDKKFVLAMTVLGASAIADGITTQRNLNQGARETNPIFGPHPSSVRLAGVNAAYFAGEFAEAYFLKKCGRGKWWSKLWLIEPSYQIQEHARFAIHNARTHR